MSKRYEQPIYGKRFCWNTNKKEVHDLDRELGGRQEKISHSFFLLKNIIYLKEVL